MQDSCLSQFGTWIASGLDVREAIDTLASLIFTVEY